MDDGIWPKTAPPSEIFVVDDDPAIREILSMVLSAVAIRSSALRMARRCWRGADPMSFLHPARCPHPRQIGLDILKELHGEDYPAPIFMISGQGDIAMAVSAIKSGALDFIEKPFRAAKSSRGWMRRSGHMARRQAEDSASNVASLHFPGREPLTRRERESAWSSSPPAPPTRKPGASSESARVR